MNVRWSAEAVAALVAIEVRLVARYSEIRATEIIDVIWLPTQQPTFAWQTRWIVRVGLGATLDLEGALDASNATGRLSAPLFF